MQWEVERHKLSDPPVWGGKWHGGRESGQTVLTTHCTLICSDSRVRSLSKGGGEPLKCRHSLICVQNDTFALKVSFYLSHSGLLRTSSNFPPTCYVFIDNLEEHLLYPTFQKWGLHLRSFAPGWFSTGHHPRASGRLGTCSENWDTFEFLKHCFLFSYLLFSSLPLLWV